MVNLKKTKGVVGGAEGEQECWFGEKGCHESSEMEKGSLRDCCQSGVNPSTPFTGTNLGQNWIADDDDDCS